MAQTAIVMTRIRVGHPIQTPGPSFPPLRGTMMSSVAYISTNANQGRCAVNRTKARRETQAGFRVSDLPTMSAPAAKLSPASVEAKECRTP
jgi:hypothetical protein